VTVSSRLTGEIGSSSNPISGMTVATLLLTCLIFLIVGWTGPTYYVTALSIGGIVCIAASNGGTTSQDLKTGFLVGSTPKHQQTAILIGALASAVVLGPILLKLNNSSTIYFPSTSFEAMETPVAVNEAASSLPAYSDQAQPTTPGSYRLLKNEAGTATAISTLDPGEYLVDQSGKAVFKVQHNFPEGLAANTSLGPAEKLEGKQGEADSNTYRTWHKTDEAGSPPGKYLVNEQGTVVYLADPGINGTHKIRPDGTTVTKFDAPKAVLMSYIIKGILNHKLPWGLVLLGVMIAIVLEMSGIPSLAFAVGVYLPLSSSSPIFIGGMIRWLVDKYIAKKFKDKNLTEEQLVAEGDKSAGVLMASGYIAGGALAGIVVAFIAGVPRFGDFNASIERWAGLHNGFFSGPNADLLSLIPFVILMILLYLAGREAILAGRSKSSST
ncbi:MAG TPA: OPT/YSL family transporter, partial [Blastocatellia bacterium]|nr:OPT/YSL family transporter [Blastocatellia bacterium]